MCRMCKYSLSRRDNQIQKMFYQQIEISTFSDDHQINDVLKLSKSTIYHTDWATYLILKKKIKCSSDSDVSKMCLLNDV